jgi:phosphoenolpyruvate synthase/pyruvate phosphate dikinase
MSSNPSGISQNVSGSSVNGGLQAAQGNNNQQIMETHTIASAEKQLDTAEVVVLLTQIEKLIQSAELPVENKEEAITYLNAAKKATEKEQPNKEIVKINLKGVSETLETASKTVESSKSLWEAVKPILLQLPGWLGVAKSFFGF